MGQPGIATPDKKTGLHATVFYVQPLDICRILDYT